jgi:hypothetical protein
VPHGVPGDLVVQAVEHDKDDVVLHRQPENKTDRVGAAAGCDLLLAFKGKIKDRSLRRSYR